MSNHMNEQIILAAGDVQHMLKKENAELTKEVRKLKRLQNKLKKVSGYDIDTLISRFENGYGLVKLF